MLLYRIQTPAVTKDVARGSRVAKNKWWTVTMTTVGSAAYAGILLDTMLGHVHLELNKALLPVC